MSPPETRPARPVRARRRGYWIYVVGYFICTLTAFVWLGPTDFDRSRRLAEVHEVKAAACRSLERVAQADSRVEEVEALARSAINHDWFARAYTERGLAIGWQRWNLRFWQWDFHFW